MDTNKVDLNLLIALEALLSERNVTKAAQRLNISQSALSARLNRLRDLFNDPLLIPTRRGMTATDRALALQEPLRLALDNVRAVVAEQKLFDPKTETALMTLAGSDYVQHAYLTPLVQTLREEAPGIRFAWHNLNFDSYHSSLESGEIDFVFMPPQTSSVRLRFCDLHEERYVAISRKKHPNLSGHLSITKFCSLEHIVRSPRGGGFSGPTDDALKKLNRTRNVVLSVPSWLMVPRIVKSTNLVAVVPERLVRNQEDQLEIYKLPFSVRGFKITMFWHNRIGESQVHLWLRNRISQVTSCL